MPSSPSLLIRIKKGEEIMLDYPSQSGSEMRCIRVNWLMLSYPSQPKFLLDESRLKGVK